MHIADEVRREFEEVVRDSAHIPTVCMFLTPAYIPYVIPYLTNLHAAYELGAVHVQPGYMCVCVYDQIDPKGYGFVRQYPIAMNTVVGCITTTALMCKALGQVHNVVLCFDEDGKIEECMRMFRDMAAPAIKNYVDTKADDAND